MKLTAEKRVERAHVQLMQDPEFCLFSGVFMVGETKVSDTVPTAYTNGRDVTYGRAFVDQLSDPELNFVVLHETMHKAYRHLLVWQGLAKQEPMLANMAMDYVINLQLMDMKKPNVIQMPKDKDGKTIGLIDEQYRGMDTKQVFDKLKKQARGGGEGGQQDGKSGCLDDHGWNEAKDLPQEEKDKLVHEIDQALREGVILAGRMKGKVNREITELLNPRVDWKQVMREFIKTATKGMDNSTWRKPHKRYIGQDIVLPTYISQKVGRIAVAIDTSGSIGGPELGQFLGEVKSICDEVAPEAIELMYWDTQVAKHETYEAGAIETLTSTTRPVGGGGTSPRCVPAYMSKNFMDVQCTVMLTDGYFYGGECGDWNEVSSPVLWCVVGNKKFTPTVGQAVFIGD